MASYSIEKRTLASGESRYKATVTVKHRSKIAQRFSKTHKKKTLATAWAKNEVRKIDEGETQDRSVPIGQLLDMFIENKNLWDNTGRSKQTVLKMLRDCDIAKIYSDELTTKDLIEHCQDRCSTGTKPSTVYSDIYYLRSVFKRAKPVFNIAANVNTFLEATPILYEMKLIGKSEKRTRRPTTDEIDLLKEALEEREQRRENKIPYSMLLDFSILSCMRVSEVCGIRWEDLNEELRTVLVRDRKDPRKKEGNHMVVPLLGEAFDIVMKQERKGELIFPYNPRSVGRGFVEVCQKVGINNLRYHDLRREGASRLFEKGFTIEEVAQVTGHRNLNTLWQVYTQLFPHKLHERKI
ncbi:tyrosine-type recombinase/integrase [Vibrio splendidus]|uniref:tyrosine-type recombinase/integrase n=1 Tax=Vibrio splendidus TaxID=29497 RepID=UPI000C85A733|nr:site-specific integrase [Vibrio splendidus]PMI74646.1 integrase [Vibrio splendidus]